MRFFPRFTNRRRALQLGSFALRHGTKVFEKLNKTNLALMKQFSGREIFCNVCGQHSQLWFEMLSTRMQREHRVGPLRETLECLSCLSRMRYRVMAYALLDECKKRFAIDCPSIAALAERIGHIDILDTDAFSPSLSWLRRCPGYKISKYLPGKPAGFIAEEAVFNTDLQAMTFPDNLFDVILSSDVMEHVRDLKGANAEIYRCLKPGGAHLFTVPFFEPRPFTHVLVDTSTSEDIYLELPQIHGDDHFAGGIPAYRIFGLDLVNDLTTIGFEVDIVRIRDSRIGIYDESYFIARRPA